MKLAAMARVMGPLMIEMKKDREQGSGVREKGNRRTRWLRVVVSHPCDKNKDVARMGHPAWLASLLNPHQLSLNLAGAPAPWYFGTLPAFRA
jgi:hypothetical protein